VSQTTEIDNRAKLLLHAIRKTIASEITGENAGIVDQAAIARGVIAITQAASERSPSLSVLDGVMVGIVTMLRAGGLDEFEARVLISRSFHEIWGDSDDGGAPQ
jgi:hypothetical protein